MIPVVLLNLFILSYGVILPMYWSHKAMKSDDPKDRDKWLTHWITLMLFLVIQSVGNIFIGFWLPFYSEMVLVVFLWMMQPNLNGSSYLYNEHLKPLVTHYEGDIDEALEAIWKRAFELAVKAAENAIRYCVDTVVYFVRQVNVTLFAEDTCTGSKNSQAFTLRTSLLAKIGPLVDTGDRKPPFGDVNKWMENNQMDIDGDGDVSSKVRDVLPRVCKSNNYKKVMLSQGRGVPRFKL